MKREEFLNLKAEEITELIRCKIGKIGVRGLGATIADSIESDSGVFCILCNGDLQWPASIVYSETGIKLSIYPAIKPKITADVVPWGFSPFSLVCDQSDDDREYLLGILERNGLDNMAYDPLVIGLERDEQSISGDTILLMYKDAITALQLSMTQISNVLNMLRYTTTVDCAPIASYKRYKIQDISAELANLIRKSEELLEE